MTDSEKFVAEYDINDYEILTDTEFVDVIKLHETIPFQRYILKTENHELECADEHMVFKDNLEEVFVKDLSIGDKIKTDNGDELVVSVEKTDIFENMYDFELGLNSNHRYYTNGILSHNTTSYSIYVLQQICFKRDQRILIVGNKAETAVGILENIKMAFERLPKWLKPGVIEWNKTSIKLDNGCKIKVSATNGKSGRSGTYNLLVCDEFALVDKGLVKAFYAAAYPTISSSKESKIVIVSTPKGTDNLFYDFYCQANETNERQGWRKVVINWWDVPGRDEIWKQQQIASFGGDLIQFNQEFGNCFLGSSYTIVDSKLLQKTKDIIDNNTKNKIKFNVNNIIKDYGLTIYKYPEAKRCYVLGADCSDGVGLDYSYCSVFDITDPKKIEQVAKFSSNSIRTVEFAYIIAKAGLYYNYCPLFIESNNMGRSVLDFLFNVYEYENIASVGSRSMGIYSTSKLKTTAVLQFKNIFENVEVVFYDKELYDELQSFGRIGDRYCGTNSSHDDKILATIWAFFLLNEDNVGYFYDTDWKKINDTFNYYSEIKPAYIQSSSKIKDVTYKLEKKVDIEYGKLLDSIGRKDNMDNKKKSSLNSNTLDVEEDPDFKFF